MLKNISTWVEIFRILLLSAYSLYIKQLEKQTNGAKSAYFFFGRNRPFFPKLFAIIIQINYLCISI